MSELKQSVSGKDLVTIAKNISTFLLKCKTILGSQVVQMGLEDNRITFTVSDGDRMAYWGRDGNESVEGSHTFYIDGKTFTESVKILSSDDVTFIITGNTIVLEQGFLNITMDVLENSRLLSVNTGSFTEEEVVKIRLPDKQLKLIKHLRPKHPTSSFHVAGITASGGFIFVNEYNILHIDHGGTLPPFNLNGIPSDLFDLVGSLDETKDLFFAINDTGAWFWNEHEGVATKVFRFSEKQLLEIHKNYTLYSTAYLLVEFDDMPELRRVTRKLIKASKPVCDSPQLHVAVDETEAMLSMMDGEKLIINFPVHCIYHRPCSFTVNPADFMAIADVSPSSLAIYKPEKGEKKDRSLRFVFDHGVCVSSVMKVEV